MPTTRSRRTVRRAIVAVLGCGLLVSSWLMLREPPEIKRSHALKIGMSFEEVEAVMGPSQEEFDWGGCDRWRTTLNYGAALPGRERLSGRLSYWTFGTLRPWRPSGNDWPVRVQFDLMRPLGHVVRIDRGDEIER